MFLTSYSPSFSILLILTLKLVLSGCDDEPPQSDINDMAFLQDRGEVAGELGGTDILAGEEAGGMAGEEAGETNQQINTIIWPINEGTELTITNRPFSMTLTHSFGEPVVLLGESLGFGVVDELREDKSYDPYWLHHPYLGSIPPQSESLRWIHIIEFTQESTSTTNIEQDRLELAVLLSDESQANLILEKSSLASLALTLHYPNRESAEAAFGYWEAPARESEQFYGLGESFDHVARRGTYRALNFQIIANTESGYNEAHVPVPLLISTDGIGYFFETDLPSYFDVAYEQEDIVRAEQARPNPLKLHLLWAEKPAGILNTYYELTGRPLVPPYWAFAPHYWRNVTTGQTEVEGDMTQMRELKIPGGNFWIDRPYQQSYMDCIFDPQRYPDPSQMQRHYNDLGYKMILWHAPYISEASDAWEEADSGNYFVDGLLFFMNFGKIIDFTNPNAMDLWSRLLDRFNMYGVAGYKLDYGEDIQVGIGGNRLRYNFFDGSNELTMHHRYATFYHRAYLQTLPLSEPRPSTDLLAPNVDPHQVDGFLLGRSSTYGGQQYVHALWPGDLDSDFRTHLEEDFWVGGLPAAVIGGLTLAVSGFPFYGSDTGGFRNNRPTQEVLIRWAWQTAFSAIMQIGGGGSSHFPWAEAGDSEEVYDEQGIEWMRLATQWHLRLADYRFSYGLIARQTGQPLLQPFGFAYPKDGRHPDDVYLLGPDLLVAPIISTQSQRTVPLPEGEWYDFWTSDVINGPTEIDIDVPLGSQALFLKSGAIIPLLHPNVETLNSINQDNPLASNTVTVDQVSHPLTWLLALPTEGTTQVIYQNHEGSTVTLNANQALLTPSTNSPYGAYELSVRHDPNARLMTVTKDEIALSWVNEESSQDCLDCIWYEKAGILKARLSPHLGQAQLISWQ